MTFVSVTRLRIRAVRFLPGFFLYTWRSMRQVRRAPGFLAGELASGPSRTYWTVTVWDGEAAMRAYRVSGAHMRAMPKLLTWCDEAAVAHWEEPEAALPTVTEAAQRLGQDGRVSKVLHPTPAHARRETWPDRRVPSGNLVLTPAGRDVRQS